MPAYTRKRSDGSIELFPDDFSPLTAKPTDDKTRCSIRHIYPAIEKLNKYEQIEAAAGNAGQTIELYVERMRTILTYEAQRQFNDYKKTNKSLPRRLSFEDYGNIADAFVRKHIKGLADQNKWRAVIDTYCKSLTNQRNAKAHTKKSPHR